MNQVADSIREKLQSRSASGDAAVAGGLWPSPPSKFPPPPMTESELQLVVEAELPNWVVVRRPIADEPNETGFGLERRLRFRRFRDAITFMNDVADFADKANHHPIWENVFKTLTIYLTTFDINHRATSLDVMFASYVDKTYARYLRSGTE